ncbi:uncharacterized protein RJT20DRAFT_128018 [Scheffersomyces xylosifermentans]|uniref:uncharacterized protein n=1 Tax=Scheffersomyces xylosifermentans TaxID=1304137 RepID=UPI00315DB442
MEPHKVPPPTYEGHEQKTFSSSQVGSNDIIENKGQTTHIAEIETKTQESQPTNWEEPGYTDKSRDPIPGSNYQGPYPGPGPAPGPYTDNPQGPYQDHQRHTDYRGYPQRSTDEEAHLALLLILAFFIPVVAVILKRGCGRDAWINVLLCVISFGLLAIIHAFYIVLH